MLRRNKFSRKVFFLIEPVPIFFSIKCISPEQETIDLLQEDVGVDDATQTITAHAAAREEFTRPPKNRQQRWVTAWMGCRANQTVASGKVMEYSILFQAYFCVSVSFCFFTGRRTATF